MQVLIVKHALSVGHSNKKLVKVDRTWSVKINFVYYVLNLFNIMMAKMLLVDFKKFNDFNSATVVDVHSLENISQLFSFLLIGFSQGNKSLNDCYQIIAAIVLLQVFNYIWIYNDWSRVLHLIEPSVLKSTFGGYSLVWISAQHHIYQIIARLWYFLPGFTPERYGVIFDVLHSLFRVLPLERWDSWK